MRRLVFLVAVLAGLTFIRRRGAGKGPDRRHNRRPGHGRRDLARRGRRARQRRAAGESLRPGRAIPRGFRPDSRSDARRSSRRRPRAPLHDHVSPSRPERGRELDPPGSLPVRGGRSGHVHAAGAAVLRHRDHAWRLVSRSSGAEGDTRGGRTARAAGRPAGLDTRRSPRRRRWNGVHRAMACRRRGPLDRAGASDGADRPASGTPRGGLVPSRTH